MVLDHRPSRCNNPSSSDPAVMTNGRPKSSTKRSWSTIVYPFRSRILYWRAVLVAFIAACFAILVIISPSSTALDLQGDDEFVFAPIAIRPKWRGYLSSSSSSRNQKAQTAPKLYYPRRCSGKNECARVVPSFILAGGEHSGTLYVFQRLLTHPQIVGPSSTAGLSLVDLDNDQQPQDVLFEAYLSKFPVLEDEKRAKETIVVGEHAPEYLYNSHVVARRLREILPDVKLIFILRDPIDRAYSQYFDDPDTSTSFESLVETELGILRQCGHTTTEWDGFVRCHESSEIQAARYMSLSRNTERNSSSTSRLDLLARGMYYTALLPFLEQFPSSQLFVTRTEDILHNPSAFFQRLARFIGVDETFFSERNFYRQQRLTEAVLLGESFWPEDAWRRPFEGSSRLGRVSAMGKDMMLGQHNDFKTIPLLDLGTRYRLQKVFGRLNGHLSELFEGGSMDFPGWEYDVEKG